MQLDRSKINLLIGGMIILVLVLGVVFVLWPGEILKKTRNATRRNHMQVMMTAVYTYATGNSGLLPDCIPEFGQPAVRISECSNELSPYLMHLVLEDPDPKYSYMIEYFSKDRGIRIFSTAPEAKNLEIIR